MSQSETVRAIRLMLDHSLQEGAEFFAAVRTYCSFVEESKGRASPDPRWILEEALDAIHAIALTVRLLATAGTTTPRFGVVAVDDAVTEWVTKVAAKGYPPSGIDVGVVLRAAARPREPRLTTPRPTTK